jgi:hypothetical protein
MGPANLGTGTFDIGSMYALSATSGVAMDRVSFLLNRQKGVGIDSLKTNQFAVI